MAITLNLPASANSGKSLKIDAIRFLAAFWVLMYHFKPPLFRELLPHRLSFLGGALWSGSTALFAGPAAVIVFFVISGYCIHAAYHKDVALKPVNYYASRFIRIGLPLVVLLCVVQPLPTGQNYLESVLWSLYCEMVYYAVYPLLRPRFHYIGEMIAGCAVMAAAMVACVRLFGHPVCHGCVYETYRVPGTALLYAAGWISGCLIAETQRNAAQFQIRGAYSPLTMAMRRGLDASVRLLANHLVVLRMVVVAAGAAVMILLSESSLKPAALPLITPDITLPVFQVLAAIWIATETATPSRSGVWIVLAACGAWSYSLYLCHKTALALLEMTAFDETSRYAWFVEVALAFAISYAFYRIVEKPSHLISQRLRKYTPDVPGAPAA
ncbi:acyltransferase family protein [Paraburkholderia caribensis]|uniref:acyltransferase family protein n=1 Tax=Paraburkholderia caribensis TaxID=75105 RepID=UPI0007202B37|nr:acyltransferase family protein [Paraburkholderia caribensis]ALP67010.1 acyltransferase [Paraburkholderia caribensis]AUT56712.1 acyltransferase [Paraburkholderia caribensis]